MSKTLKSINIPPQGMKTEKGFVYPIPPIGKQIIFLVSSFFIAILFGLIVSSIPSDLSKLATGTVYFVFLFVFIISYSIWVGWTKLIAIKVFKRNLLSGVKSIITKDKKSLKESLTFDEEKLLELLVSTQKSTRIFALLGWLFGFIGGLISLSFDTSINKPILFVLIIIFSAGYGHLLYYFGRRGFFPFPEE